MDFLDGVKRQKKTETHRKSYSNIIHILQYPAVIVSNKIITCLPLFLIHIIEVSVNVVVKVKKAILVYTPSEWSCFTTMGAEHPV